MSGKNIEGYGIVFLTEMVEPNKTCEAGFYCRRSAESGTPDQGTDANICPQGHYCLNGTGEPFNCPKGTLNNQTGTYALIRVVEISNG